METLELVVVPCMNEKCRVERTFTKIDNSTYICQHCGGKIYLGEVKIEEYKRLSRRVLGLPPQKWDD